MRKQNGKIGRKMCEKLRENETKIFAEMLRTNCETNKKTGRTFCEIFVKNAKNVRQITRKIVRRKWKWCESGTKMLRKIGRTKMRKCCEHVAKFAKHGEKCETNGRTKIENLMNDFAKMGRKEMRK